MSCDWNFYYDFDTERKIEKWETVSFDKGKFTLKTELDSEGGAFVLLTWAALDYVPDNTHVTRLCVNGKWSGPLERSSPVYIYPHLSRMGFRTSLKKGTNVIQAEGFTRADDPRTVIHISLAKDLSPVERVRHREFLSIPAKEYKFSAKTPDLTGFTPGVGCTATPGRFGFSKGDGVLDCAMPTLGTIDKMYVCGHPLYKKPFRWSYSTLPEGATFHGSYSPATEGIDKDDIQVNHLSVRWGTRFGNTSYACTYSLASPGIITECDSGVMRISGLEYAGNYNWIAIPRDNGRIEVASLHDVEDIRMSENFLLLFGCTEFPDLPLLLVFKEQPERMEVRLDPATNRLSELIFHGCSLIVTATPFGFESLQPIRPDDRKFLRDAVTRARFWSRAFLAYPVRCEEYFRLDSETRMTTIVQKFSYRRIEDAWHTPPLELAPLPPVLPLCEMMKTREKPVDFLFPTKFGTLHGMFGNTSSYSIPFMPSARKFPLRDTSDPTPGKLLKKGLKEYFDFAAQFPETTQAYPYAGALMEPFAMATTLLNFMEKKDREHLRMLAAERLKGACDQERTYDYPVIDHGFMMQTMPDDKRVVDIYADPAMQHRRLWNWYERTEPFTRTKYHICYLNVCFFSGGLIKEGTREEIAGLKIPLIENDWGAGLTFYYMYLCALASGSFEDIRRNWPLLKSVYSFFEKMHDWACLGSGYSDNAISWVEGANYGAFTSFINMAEAVGDRETHERALYLASKQFALRMAVIHASQNHFSKYYGVAPWHIAKCLHEESNPAFQFQTVPSDLWRKKFRPDGIYNLTTEGIYPEIFTAMREFHPKETEIIMNLLRKALADGMNAPDNSWAVMQQTTSMLIDMALNPDVPSKKLLAEIEAAKKRKKFMKKWRGIHIFSRRLPEHYLEAQLLAWDAMKRHPLWLEHWEDLRILAADWKVSLAEIAFELNGSCPKIRFGIRKKPSAILLNGKKLPFTHRKAEKQIELSPGKSGKLEILFS